MRPLKHTARMDQADKRDRKQSCAWARCNRKPSRMKKKDPYYVFTHICECFVWYHGPFHQLPSVTWINRIERRKNPVLLDLYKTPYFIQGGGVSSVSGQFTVDHGHVEPAWIERSKVSRITNPNLYGYLHNNTPDETHKRLLFIVMRNVSGRREWFSSVASFTPLAFSLFLLVSLTLSLSVSHS